MANKTGVEIATPLEWGKRAVETVMEQYKPLDMPPANRWHYHQGVFLCGVHRIWELERSNAYFDYIKGYVDGLVDEDGNFLFRRDELDAIQAGLLLFPLYKDTGEYRYKEAARKLRSLLDTLNRNRDGGFWHKDKYPNQMWLDGLYMAGPFAIQYGQQFNEGELIDLVLAQEQLMRTSTKDEQTGLYVHAWDASKQAEVCDPVTGKTTEVWGRALGWYAMTLIDFIDLLHKEPQKRAPLIKVFQALMTRLIAYQDEESGLWYQVVDKGDKDGNWLESSCSCLFAYALAKGNRLGFLDDQALQQSEKAFNGILAHSVEVATDGSVSLHDICIGTSIGRYQDYINRPTTINDLHGVGAFALCTAELEKALRQ
ncbi:glycoside hydrolase family 88 protein [Bacillus sp. JCM 19041]|uniref:glycoside hydrolase family 88/105 protein n=1 Tax=Bacillus sp. JCM 19041 TaxID=1460637 RepID=UPI0006D27FA9